MTQPDLAVSEEQHLGCNNEHNLNQLKQTWGFIIRIFGISHRKVTKSRQENGRDEPRLQDKNQILEPSQDAHDLASVVASHFSHCSYASSCGRKHSHWHHSHLWTKASVVKIIQTNKRVLAFQKLPNWKDKTCNDFYHQWQIHVQVHIGWTGINKEQGHFSGSRSTKKHTHIKA